MVLDRLKQMLGMSTVDAYERDVLEREYGRLEEKIQAKQSQLGQVHCTGCAKKEDPHARRIIAAVDKMRKRQKEIERKLGGKPELHVGKRRKSKRASA